MHRRAFARAPARASMLRRARLGRLLWATLLALGVLAAATATRAAQPRVVVLPATGVVDQVMAGYIREGISRAADEGAAAVVIRLDTPGGSVDSTREIVKSLLEAPVPTIV